MAYSRNKNPFELENDFRYGTRSKNPFEDEENDDNFEDVGKSPEFLRLKQEKELLEKRMVDSSFRSVNMISESQQVASETAEELLIQREKLEKTNRTLDKMQDDLTSTERNITSMKSIWGTMSNWFKKPLKTSNTSDDPEPAVKDVTDSIKQSNDEMEKKLKKIDSDYEYPATQMHHQQPKSVNDVVDQNLDHMLAGLTALKSQGIALGEEIEYQNQLVDTISQKVDKTDSKITNQDAKIRKMLK